MAARGQPKTGGRKKGTPNKKTQEVAAIFDELDFCPVRKAVFIFRRALKEFKDDKSDYRFKYLEIAQRQIMDLTQYRHPKRKAIEHTGADGESLANTLADLVASVADKPKKSHG